MRKPLLSAAIAALPFLLTAQNATVDWVHSFGDTNFDRADFVQTDAAGNVYVAGPFDGAIDFDPGPGNTTIYTQEPGLYIQKLDPDGNLIWVKCFTDDAPKSLSAMTLASDGSIWLAGTFSGTFDLDPGSGVAELTAVSQHLYLAKLDNSGNFLWGGQLGGTGDNDITKIVTDQNGNLLLTGYFEGNADFNPGTGTNNLNAAAYKDSFILKLDANGNFQWVKRIGGGEYDMAQSIGVDQQNNIYVAGSFQGNVDFNPGGGTHFIQVEGNTDGFLLKLTEAGAFVWVRSLGGLYAEIVTDLAVSSDGSIYIDGYLNSPEVNFDPGATDLTITGQGYNNLFVLKASDSGGLLWVKTFGNPIGSVYGSKLALSPEGTIFAMGTHNSSFDADPGTGTAFTSSTNGFYVLSLDETGNYLWNESFAKDSSDSDFFLCRDIAFDLSGNFYIAGAYTGTIDADPGAGETELTSIGHDDAFLIKQQFVLGIGEPENTTGTIWPNPFSNATMITLDRPVEYATMKILSMDGQTIRILQNVSGTKIGLNREQLPAGVYLVRIEEGNRIVATERIVIID
jgi:hypothetical protein